MAKTLSNCSARVQALRQQLPGARLTQGCVAEAGGVYSALLACAGLTGPKRFPGGVYCYFKPYATGTMAPAKIMEASGERRAVARTMFKPYSSCRLTQRASELPLPLIGANRDSLILALVERIGVRADSALAVLLLRDAL